MIALDVHYYHNSATVAGIHFHTWQQGHSDAECSLSVSEVAPYESGQFYKRELPCLLQFLRQQSEKPNLLVIDGHVFLDGHERPGLGKYLFDALEGQVPVIGVAKRGFQGIDPTCRVWRGASQNPLFVSAVGAPLEDAKVWIQQMHGPFRIPTLLKRVDQLCRGG